eukprot:TRINITY_DN11588_c1_g1_i1.p1 TRINITY_DN11588_c1_g1~~TRINITY_DN11588_c1_g1_i1.p1  ORF type:complete len:292 (-),score=45.47 TRINITY_DN11588_c1_g1_i1:212-1063(-)
MATNRTNPLDISVIEDNKLVEDPSSSSFNNNNTTTTHIWRAYNNTISSSSSIIIIIMSNIGLISDMVGMSIYGVLTLVIFICWTHSLRTSIPNKKRIRHEILGLSCAWSALACIQWSLNHFVITSDYAMGYLLPFAFSSVFHLVFEYTAFTCVLLCWVDIMAVKYEHNHIVYKICHNKKKVIISSVAWTLLCFIGALIGFIATDNLQFYAIGILSISIIPMCLTIGFAFLYRALARFLRELGSEHQKGNLFRRKITILTAIFIVRLDLVIIDACTLFLYFPRR